MRIAFFTEGPTGIKYPENYVNMRTDVAWQVSLDAVSLNHNTHLQSYTKFDNFDLGIIIVPKKEPKIAMECFRENRQYCNKWAVMQEGPHEYYQDWPIETQIQYIDLLNSVDMLFCHNEYDFKYYAGLFPNKHVNILPTLMIDDAIPKNRLVDPVNRNGVMIGGNWCSWYSGQDSNFIASLFNEKVFAPSMGRKPKDEDQIFGIEHIAYRNWAEWIVILSQVKYAVHLMRTYAAGTFALNCAYLGIPCIGYENLDTQRICFPELTLREGDLKRAAEVAKNLKNNKLFYDHVSAYAKKAWRDHYHESVFKNKFENIIKHVLK